MITSILVITIFEIRSLIENTSGRILKLDIESSSGGGPAADMRNQAAAVSRLPSSNNAHFKLTKNSRRDLDEKRKIGSLFTELEMCINIPLPTIFLQVNLFCKTLQVNK